MKVALPSHSAQEDIEHRQQIDYMVAILGLDILHLRTMMTVRVAVSGAEMSTSNSIRHLHSTV